MRKNQKLEVVIVGFLLWDCPLVFGYKKKKKKTPLENCPNKVFKLIKFKRE